MGLVDRETKAKIVNIRRDSKGSGFLVRKMTPATTMTGVTDSSIMAIDINRAIWCYVKVSTYPWKRQWNASSDSET